MTQAEWHAWAASNWPNYVLTQMSKPANSSFQYSAVNALVRYSGVFSDGGVMWGSPVSSNARWTFDSNVNRVTQHAVRSATDWAGIKAAGASAVVFFVGLTSSQTSFNPYLAVTRNGYTSYSYGSYSVTFTTAMLYYSVDLGYPVVGMGDTYARYYHSVPAYFVRNGAWQACDPFVLVGGVWKSIINCSAKV